MTPTKRNFLFFGNTALLVVLAISPFLYELHELYQENKTEQAVGTITVLGVNAETNTVTYRFETGTTGLNQVYLIEKNREKIIDVTRVQ